MALNFKRKMEIKMIKKLNSQKAEEDGHVSILAQKIEQTEQMGRDLLVLLEGFQEAPVGEVVAE
jgi:hypothetical protein